MATAEGYGRGPALLAVQQQLRATYGIKMKIRAAKGKPPAATEPEGGKVFGIALPALPQQVVPEYGSIPCFLVEACKYLEEHIHTEGLFRKSGSFVRLKTLKNKLDQGENCLSTAQPCDVAGLLKQFFRELPEPIFPSDLQEALIKAQQLSSEEEKNSATLLLSCFMNDTTVDTLKYFFNFLKKVSLRSTENKMDSSNLAVIFAPNLLQSSDTDKMSAHTDRKLRLQASVVQTLINHAEEIGHIPKFILEKIPAMLGIDDSVSTPSLQDYEESEGETPGECKRRRRRSIGDIVSGALNKLKSNRTPCTTPLRDESVFSSVTPMIVTPSIKRKCPADSYQSFSNKKRRSLRHNLALELLPSSIFSISSTPASAQFEGSPCISLEAPQSSLSTSVTSDKHLPALGSRRSKRLASKKVHRVESGKTGCFSPKISRKEIVRRSLRLKFSLGKSNKENTAIERSVTSRSENIGRRLASQQDTESGADFLKPVQLLSTCAGGSIIRKGSKSISMSQENLLIPDHHDEASYRISWTGPNTTEPQETVNSGATLKACLEAETCSSEPALSTRKCSDLTVVPQLREANKEQYSNKQQISFCEEENNLTTDTLLKIKKAFSESGSNLHNLCETESSKSDLTQAGCISESVETRCLKVQEIAKVEKKSMFANQCSDTDKLLSNMDKINTAEIPFFQTSTLTDHPIHELSKSGESAQEAQLTEPISPSNYLNQIDTLQKETLEPDWQSALGGIVEDNTLKACNSEKKTEFLGKKADPPCSQLPEDKDRNSKQHLHMETFAKSKHSPSGKVADHIHWFNKLSLNEPCSATKTKPPLKFQRTPVRQSVRRMNSLLEANRQAVTCKLRKSGDSYPLVKSVSFETALSSCAERISSTDSLPSESTNKQTCTSDQFTLSSKSYPHLIYPVEPAGKLDNICKEKCITNNQSKSVLEDLTNHDAPKTIVKVNTNMNISVATPDKSRKTSLDKKLRYRGSPKNPVSITQLLPVIKPLDF